MKLISRVWLGAGLLNIMFGLVNLLRYQEPSVVGIAGTFNLVVGCIAIPIAFKEEK